MTVSFTGINNIKVFKKKPFSYDGFCTDSEGYIKKIVKSKDEMLLKFDLCNDAAGNDLDEFNKVMSKTKSLSSVVSKNTEEPYAVKLLAKSISTPKEKNPHKQTSFYLNDNLVPIMENSDMAVLSYLAKLTRKMSKNTEITDVQRDYIEKTHKCIHEEAMKYINR